MKLLYRRKGFPEEGELVLCRVLKVNPHSAFVNLEEYDKQGLIHISEISPGRVRNLYDYVKPDKIIVCKVLRVNEERGHIDLSLRRVTELQRRKKVDEIKQEQTAEKIVEQLAINLKKDFKELYKEIALPILEEYTYLFECFDDIVKGVIAEDDLKRMGVPSEIIKDLIEIVKQRIKPKKKVIKGLLKLTTYDPKGVEVVKSTLKDALGVTQALKKEGVEGIDGVLIMIKYAGSGKYLLEISADDYKTAEVVLKRFLNVCEDNMKEHEGGWSFERHEEK